MAPSFSTFRRFKLFFLLVCALALNVVEVHAAPPVPFLARSKIETDGRVMVRWNTSRGMQDTLQISQDLSTWAETGVSIYGTGGETAVHVFTAAVPGQPATPAPTNQPRTICRLFWITTYRAAANAPPLAVIGTRDSLQQVWTVRVNADFRGPEEDFLGMFSLSGAEFFQQVGNDTHPVVLMGKISDWPNATVFQPTQDLNEVPLETRVWIQKLVARADLIRQQRIQRIADLASFRLTQPQSQPPPGAKAWFRVLRSSQDSDGDSITDDEEWANGNSAFAADSNYDGITDAQAAGNGSTADSDKDGLVDDDDAVPWDKKLHFKRVPETSYAYVGLGAGYATFINDRNEVVVENTVYPAIHGDPIFSERRIWNAVEGVSRPVFPPAVASWRGPVNYSDWLPSLPLIRDLDNEGRLLVDDFTVAGKPSLTRTALIENAASADPVYRLLPFPGLPAGMDIGADGVYSGGTSIRAPLPGGGTGGGLLSGGGVLFARMAAGDGSSSSEPGGTLSKTTSGDMSGGYWLRSEEGTYQFNGNFANMAVQGLPTGYSLFYGYSSQAGITTPMPFGNTRFWDGTWTVPSPAHLTYGYEAEQFTLRHNRSGWISAEHRPGLNEASGENSRAKSFWRVDRPTKALAEDGAGYATTRFWPIKIASKGLPFGTLPGITDLLGGPFACLTDMKRSVCGSGPLLIEQQQFD